MNWDHVVEKVAPYIVKIETPTGHGTGYLFLYNENQSLCGIATALHVVDYANEWQQPIRLIGTTNSIAFLKETDRVIFHDARTDSAVILFSVLDFVFPKALVPLLPTDTPLSVGAEVGWLGFPSIEPHTMCFFSGNVSARQEYRQAYLIDGVAIGGVSGGPVVRCSETDGVQIVGTVSAYRANRTTGETLPGLLIAQDVSHFHNVASHVRSIDEAKAQQQMSIESN